MRRNVTIATVLDVVSVLSIALALFSAMFVDGPTQNVLLRIAGIFLVLSVVVSRYVPGRADIQQDVKNFGGAPSDEKRSWWQDALVVIGLISGLLMGYLIFAAPKLPEHKLYIVACGVVFGITFALSRLSLKRK